MEVLSSSFSLSLSPSDTRGMAARHAGRLFWRAMTRASLVALAVHVCFIVLFWRLGARHLALFNVGSVGLYGCTYMLFRRHYNLLAIWLVWIEVHVHAALAVHALGWDSGFHYYLLTFVPLIFVSSARQTRSKVLLLLVLCSFYMLLDAYMRNTVPSEAIAPAAQAALRYFNIATTFLMLGYLAYFYFRQVRDAEHKLRVMATTDYLTGLANRRRILDVARYEVLKRKRQPSPMTFVLADIDHFKAINDGHGHEAGDQVLSTVSQRLKHTVREQDTVARWGGEEFLIVMPGASEAVALAVAQRLRQAVSSTTVEACGQALPVTMTFGVSEYQPFESIEACISRADQALYRGKAAGRNCVQGDAH